ncbi:phosphomannomutase/phosphoglucomutase [bacterium]|nr:phosphomannomutase/phosphoglucomutase [bacterium]
MGVFKSYDIRGTYPDQIDATLARKIGISLGRHFRGLDRNQGKPKLKLVVGRDMRTMAPEITAAFIDGLITAGHDVVDIGMVTTPCQYFAIQHLSADGGIMVTASHNPPKYIGFKVSRELAIPISFDTGLGAVEKGLDEPSPSVPVGSRSSMDVDDLYLDFLVKMGKNLRPIKIAADASNGMVGKYLQRLFDRLPCQLEGIYLDPDGTFPNHEADPLKPENLRDVQALVKKTGAAIGFCYDGDGDRVAIVDDQGEPVGCDLITALMAQDLLKEQPGRIVTYDLRSSRIVREVVEQAGGKAVRSRVGHAHVKQQMRQIEALSGGELSGHYYFELKEKETFYADAALVATMRLLNILSQSDKSASELLAPLRKYYHSGEINFQIADKDAAIADIEKTFHDGKQDRLDGITAEYPDWWLNVRPSNTEPLLRLTLEGTTPAIRDAGLSKVFAVLEKYGHRAEGGH